MTDKLVAHWVERSRYDLDTAKVMLNSGRLLYVAYMCQQAVEKQNFWMMTCKRQIPKHQLN